MVSVLVLPQQGQALQVALAAAASTFNPVGGPGDRWPDVPSDNREDQIWLYFLRLQMGQLRQRGTTSKSPGRAAVTSLLPALHSQLSFAVAGPWRVCSPDTVQPTAHDQIVCMCVGVSLWPPVLAIQHLGSSQPLSRGLKKEWTWQPGQSRKRD